MTDKSIHPVTPITNTPIMLMPHHFIDIVRADMSRWAIPPKSKIGHRVHEACLRIFADKQTPIQLADGIDDICATCDRFTKGRCDNTIDTDFRKNAPPSMYDYNRLIDARWRDRLSLTTGQTITAQAFVERLRDHAGDIATIYPETPADTMAQWTEKIHQGIKNYLDSTKAPPKA